MKRITVLLIALLVLLPILNVFAETDIKAEVDKTSITTDDYITYKVIISSSDISPEQNIPSPQLPKFEGFNVLSQAQSSNISIDKGVITTTFIWTCILSPENTGKFKIEPSQVKLKDKTYSSEAFEIDVKEKKQRQDRLDQEEPQQITL